MSLALPMVYACSGCSAAGQMANAMAVLLDHEGLATMGCLSGVGARLPALLRVAQAGFPILAINGCEMRCTEHCLRSAGITPDRSFSLATHGVAKGEGRGFSLQEMERLLPRLKAVCVAMAAEPGAPTLAGSMPMESRFIPISG